MIFNFGSWNFLDREEKCKKATTKNFNLSNILKYILPEKSKLLCKFIYDFLKQLVLIITLD